MSSDKQVKVIENIPQIDDIKNFKWLDIADTELEFVQNEIRHENLKFLSEEDKSKNELQ